MNVIEKFRKYRKEKFQLGGTLSRERKIDDIAPGNVGLTFLDSLR